MSDEAAMILQSTDRRAERLIASLPYALRLSVTRQRFPHVVERIAAEWEAPRRFLQLMDELLIDQRGHRAGFPFDCILELTNLREYYLNRLKIGRRGQPADRRGVWGAGPGPNATRSRSPL